ncbi:aspartate kinase [Shewanella marina]|uniref:aspartate kinase n=1 Tax=Shewanella marina TaxID=487319 RepID=UPI0004704435|nr:aspartate kinase [Shewanella marina]
MLLQVQPSAVKLLVKKFGGTSVGSIERIEVIADKIADAFHAGEQQVVVLSAMAGATNHLFALADQIDPHANARELDMLVSTGEQVSIALMAMALQKRGIKAKSLTGAQVSITTNNQFGRASIEQIDCSQISELLAAETIPVIAGFQGVTGDGDITTLGRGGSDTTAVAIAATIGADECQIYTDVCGVFTTDPNIEPSAKKLDQISFSEMYEMARLGAKVLHPDSVSYAERFGVKLRVLSSFESGTGTLIEFDHPNTLNNQIAGIAVAQQQVLMQLDLTEVDNDSHSHLFQQLSQQGIEADLITSLNTDVPQLSFVVNQSLLASLLAQLDNLSQSMAIAKIDYKVDLVKISIVGKGVIGQTGTVAKIFEILGDHEIHARLMSTSDIKLSLIIEQKDLHKAVRALHHAFELNKA